MINSKYDYKNGEYAYFIPKGEIVKILSSTTKQGVFKTKNIVRVMSLNEIDPNTGKVKQYYDCSPGVLSPIVDQDIQFLLKLSYSCPKFNTIRQLK